MSDMTMLAIASISNHDADVPRLEIADAVAVSLYIWKGDNGG